MITFLKKSVINLILIVAFCLLVTALVRPLVAELKFTDGEKLAARFKWAEAETKFLDAIKIDPFSSRYLAGLGEFLLLQARYSGNKAPLIERAVGLYGRALELDPKNAEYCLKLGAIELSRKNYAEAFEDFRKAAENDPNGFNVAYGIGIAGIGVWKNINEADRLFVVERLKIAMMTRPSGDIYLKAWNARKDMELLRTITPDDRKGWQGLYNFIVSQNLWQFRKEEAERLNRYTNNKTKKPKLLKEVKEAKSAISAADWQGSTSNGKNKYKNGNMYWSGTMDAAISIPKGSAILRIRAKGQPAGGVWPYMIVELGGEGIDEMFVDTADWKEYDFKVDTEGGAKILRVTFANDGGNAKEDRNLFVGSAEIVKNDK